MKQKIIICGLFLFLFSVSPGLYASDLKVGDITLSSTNWGAQTASIKLSNTGEDYKFVVLKSEVITLDNESEAAPFTKAAYFIEPLSDNDFTLPVNITAGYGKIQIDISFYEVIDTLDLLLESQRFFTKSFPVEYKISEKLKSVISDEIKFPKFVEDNEFFSNHLSQVLLTLIIDGKTIQEIADLYQTNIEFVNSMLEEYQKAGLVSSDGMTASINFMTINKKQAEAIMPSIDNAVDNLYKVITKNFAGYDSTLTVLVSEGRLSNDPHDALDLGTILYQKSPVMLGLFLWDLLGREFVNNSQPFNIFAGSDPCNAFMGDFMYMMIGAGNYVGDSYYYASMDPQNDAIYCGLGRHNFICPYNYRDLAEKKRPVRPGFDSKNRDKVYLYNEDNVREPLSFMMDGTIEHLENLKVEMAKNFAGTYYDTNYKGARYWCWDMVVTKLMKKLVDNHVIEKDDILLYRLQKTEN